METDVRVARAASLRISAVSPTFSVFFSSFASSSELLLKELEAFYRGTAI
jgi:hypothetical protein